MSRIQRLFLLYYNAILLEKTISIMEKAGPVRPGRIPHIGPTGGLIMKRTVSLALAAALAALLLGCGYRQRPAPPAPTAEPAATAQTVWQPGVQLIDGRTRWRCLLDGTDPAAGAADRACWTRVGFDDGAWRELSGSFGEKGGERAPLGEGFAPTQLLPAVREDGSPIPGWFFRATLQLEHTRDIEALSGTLYYDDAVIVTINGVVVFEGNLPEEGFESNLSFGAQAGHDLPLAGAFTVPASMLREGENVVAVELHQAWENSTDAYFAFPELRVDTAYGLLALNTLDVFAGGDESCVSIRWRGAPDGMLCYAAGDLSGQNIEPKAVISVESQPFGPDESCRTAALTGLSPASAYTYWIESEGRKSALQVIKTGDPSDFTLLCLGDPQLTGKTTTAALSRIAEDHADVSLILSLGDQVNNADKVSQYESFLNVAAFSRIPLALCRGNHEDAALHEVYFSAPAELTGTDGDHAFCYGNAQFICLESNDTAADGHEAFLRERMAAHPEKWTVVAMHHSPFGIGRHSDDADTAVLQREYAALFARLDVDLVLSGHDHLYARTGLMENLTPVPGKEREVLFRQPGQTLYVSAGSSTGSKYYEMEAPDAAPFAFSGEPEQPGYLRIRVTETAIAVEAFNAEDGSRIDTVTLVRAGRAQQP